MRSSDPVEFARRVRPRVVERVGHGWRFLPTHPRSTQSTTGGRPAPPARASGLGEPRHELTPHGREAAVRRVGHLVRHSHEVASQGGRAAVHQGRSPRALPTHGRRGVADLPHDRPAVGVNPMARPTCPPLPGRQRAARGVVAACRVAGETAATTASTLTGIGRDDEPPAAPPPPDARHPTRPVRPPRS